MIRIRKDSREVREELLNRATFMTDKLMQEQVANMIEDVALRGDQALFDFTCQYDQVEIKQWRVPEHKFKQAYDAAPSTLMMSLQKAMDNIRAYHQKQVQNSYFDHTQDGIILGQRVQAIEAVGLYIPGGSANYPSTILMNVIPAQIAGCERIIIVSPPGKDGEVDQTVLATAYLLGVEEVYRVGGAQAIAALAFGTQSIPKVDKICGPGNAYVTLAKKQVHGLVGIDMIAGPSEVLVIADSSAQASYVAADLIAQAEHDTQAMTLLLTESEEFAHEVNEAIKQQIADRMRAKIIRPALINNSAIVIVESINAACELSNLVAPEHLELAVAQPFDLLAKIKHAGSVFLGSYTPEVLGDYFAGPNHTLPTSGNARFSSALSVDDFIKKSSVVYYTKQALKNVQQDVEVIALAEELDGHAYAMRVRFEEDENE